MTAIIGNGGGIVAGVGDGGHIRPRIGIARRFAQQVGGTGQIVVFVAIAGAAPRRVGEARDEVGAMPNRDDTTLGVSVMEEVRVPLSLTEMRLPFLSVMEDRLPLVPKSHCWPLL